MQQRGLEANLSDGDFSTKRVAEGVHFPYGRVKGMEYRLAAFWSLPRTAGSLRPGAVVCTLLVR